MLNNGIDRTTVKATISLYLLKQSNYILISTNSSTLYEISSYLVYKECPKSETSRMHNNHQKTGCHQNCQILPNRLQSAGNQPQLL